MSERPESLRDAHFYQLNAYQQNPAYRTLQGYEDRVAFFARQVGRKWEIDQAIHEEFLNLLPPLGYRADSFYMSEFLFNDITCRFAREGEHCFCEIAYYPYRSPMKHTQVPPSDPKPRG